MSLRFGAIGIGPHFRGRYFPVLERLRSVLDLRFVFAADLETLGGEVVAFFHAAGWSPETYVAVPDRLRNVLSEEDVAQLFASVPPVDALLICTEPKAHVPYALWSLGQAIDVFMDKPISAFSTIENSDSLVSDFEALVARQRSTDARCVVSCERRLNPAHRLLLERASAFLQTQQLPLTHIDIRFGGGAWMMPQEYRELENHPYKYGYGVLLHTGYHFIDYLAAIVATNAPLFDRPFGIAELSTIRRTPFDLFYSLNGSEVQTSSHALPLAQSGEIDLLLSGAAGDGERVITTFLVGLLESTISLRTDGKRKKNFYAEGGRIRQEDIWLHFGPLCSMRLQSYPYKSFRGAPCPCEHVVIEIFRNALAPGLPYEVIDRARLSELAPDFPLDQSLNIRSRQLQLEDFLRGGSGGSPLASHRLTVGLLQLIFAEIKRRREVSEEQALLLELFPSR